jgi:hypothetical protein
MLSRLRLPLVAIIAAAALACSGTVAAQGRTGSGTSTVKVVGDTPADYPGVGSPADTAPTTVVVRPQPAVVVHSENQVLPIALAALALAIALGGAAIVLLRTRPTWPAGVSH